MEIDLGNSLLLDCFPGQGRWMRAMFLYHQRLSTQLFMQQKKSWIQSKLRNWAVLEEVWCKLLLLIQGIWYLLLKQPGASCLGSKLATEQQGLSLVPVNFWWASWLNPTFGRQIQGGNCICYPSTWYLRGTPACCLKVVCLFQYSLPRSLIVAGDTGTAWRWCYPSPLGYVDDFLAVGVRGALSAGLVPQW